MKNQLQSLKSELKFIDHFLNGWEDYKIQKNIKFSWVFQWKNNHFSTQKLQKKIKTLKL